ncbi:MAG: FAD-binding protein, partial [Candidatus Omnitrophota bacterium]
MLRAAVREKMMEISGKYGGEVVFDHPLHGHSAIGIGGNASAWYTPSSQEELVALKDLLDDAGIKIITLGAGSNVLIPDEGLDAVVVNLSKKAFTGIRIDGSRVTAGAGTRLGALVDTCCRNGLAGMEGLIGIPGTVGGALKGNASYKTEISECLERVMVLGPRCGAEWRSGNELEFGYRTSSFEAGEIILQADFRLYKGEEEELREKEKVYFLGKMAK